MTRQNHDAQVTSLIELREAEIAKIANSREEVVALRHHLQEIIQAKAFRGSLRSVQFLAYIVNQAIAGHFDSLKERVIGIRVSAGHRLMTRAKMRSSASRPPTSADACSNITGKTAHPRYSASASHWGRIFLKSRASAMATGLHPPLRRCPTIRQPSPANPPSQILAPSRRPANKPPAPNCIAIPIQILI